MIILMIISQNKYSSLYNSNIKKKNKLANVL